MFLLVRKEWKLPPVALPKAAEGSASAQAHQACSKHPPGKMCCSWAFLIPSLLPFKAPGQNLSGQKLDDLPLPRSSPLHRGNSRCGEGRVKQRDCLELERKKVVLTGKKKVSGVKEHPEQPRKGINRNTYQVQWRMAADCPQLAMGAADVGLSTASRPQRVASRPQRVASRPQPAPSSSQTGVRGARAALPPKRSQETGGPGVTWAPLPGRPGSCPPKGCRAVTTDLLPPRTTAQLRLHLASF